MATTPEGLYVPERHKIALCPGVEGVWNDGVYECFASTITAMLEIPKYQSLLKAYGLTEKLPPNEWRRLKDNDFQDKPELGELWRLFRAQRPIVKVAEDYLYNVIIADKNPEVIEQFLSEPTNVDAYQPFYRTFERVAKENLEDGTLIGDLFYNEKKGTGRRWLQQQDIFDWQDLNEPMPDALREFRKIIDATKKYGGEHGGYTLWFVTTKGEIDSFILCDAYRRLGLLGEDEYTETGGRVCIVSRERIIGRETLDRIKKRIMEEQGVTESTSEFEKEFKRNATTYQLMVVHEKMNIPFPQILKLDDRIEESQIQQVRTKNSRQLCITKGYAFDFQVEEAIRNPYVDLVNSENMSVETGEIVRGMGYD
jgi:hypothetical protein